MKWSLKLGSIAGIKIYMHWTFLILVGWIFMLHIGQGHTTAVALQGVAFVVALFGCVVLHELGHALTAKRFHIQTRDITLLPIGGVARLERMPRDPTQELLVALAGPAVNVVIAAVLFGALMLLRKEPFAGVEVAGGNYWAQLMIANVILVFFNLLPAFPMDGGRVLRALLARRMPYERATELAARIGQGMAILFGFVGVFVFRNIWLVFIAFFVFLGAEGEARMVQLTTSIRGVKVEDAMITRFRALAADDTLSTAVNELLAGSQHDFPVLEGDRVAGMLTRADLVKALSEGGRDSPVGSVMRTECEVVKADEMLEKSYETLRRNGCSTLPVVRDGKLVGLVTLENIGELVMVNSAMHQVAAPAPPKLPSA